MKKITFCLLMVMLVSCSQSEVIATVNGKKISSNDLKKELAKWPEDIRIQYEKDYPGFLEELITKEVLLQEAKRLKCDTIKEVKSRIAESRNKRDDILIEELLKREVLAKVTVSEDEIRKFYDDNKSQMKGTTYEQIKPQLYDLFLQQKQQDALETYITNLREKAKITRNEKWLAAEETKLKNPINDALENNLPTMVDFGSGTCIPCIKMKPIIEEMQKEYKDRANILLIDVKEEPILVRKYKIMLIPTQIFFDTSGVEITRHVGFFPKDSILLDLNKAGLQ